MKSLQKIREGLERAYAPVSSATKKYNRRFAFGFKVTSAGIGILYVVAGIVFFLLFNKSGLSAPADLNELFFILSGVTIMIIGISLISFLPASLKAKFKRPPIKPTGSKSYGFISMLAIGVGSTLGSPLFILIPVNVTQYAIVSIISMCIAAVLSLGMTYAYSRMFNYSEDNKLETVGAASFTKLGAGTKSVRYFVARVSMWVGNTALAAYSAIIFYEFVFRLLPTLTGHGIGTQVFQLFLVLVFITWFVVNAFYERRFIRLIGNVQIVLVLVFALILLVFGLGLIDVSHANFNGFLTTYHGNFAFDLIVNTGYLYILFFGFQGIMTLNLEGRDSVRMPVLGRILKRETLSKREYLYLAMVLTIVVSATINIIVALGVFTLHVNLNTVSSYGIPLVVIAGEFLGNAWEYLISAAFMIATITTFIPAFLSSSRHLNELSRDGFFPHAFSDFSWIFTVGFLLVLSITRPDFLVNITDFTILISLGIIMFSSVWLLRSRFPKYKKWQWTSLVVGAFTFVFAASLYFNGASIVAFGIMALFLTYVFYDAYELGSIGIQMLLIFLVLSLSMIEMIYPIGAVSPLYSNRLLFGIATLRSEGAIVLMFIGLLLIIFNLFVDIRVIRGISRRNSLSSGKP